MKYTTVNGKKAFNRFIQLCKAKNNNLIKYINTKNLAYRNILIKHSEFDITDIDRSISLYYDNCSIKKRRICRRRSKAGKDYWPYDNQ